MINITEDLKLLTRLSYIYSRSLSMVMSAFFFAVEISLYRGLNYPQLLFLVNSLLAIRTSFYCRLSAFLKAHLSTTCFVAEWLTVDLLLSRRLNNSHFFLLVG